MSLFNSGSNFEPIALTMLMILFTLLLQKPSDGSKQMGYLEKRLMWWKEGKVQLLLDECRAVQDRLHKSKSTPQEGQGNVKAFTRLMLQRRVSAALRFICSHDKVIYIWLECFKPYSELHTVYNALFSGLFKVFST